MNRLAELSRDRNILRRELPRILTEQTHALTSQTSILTFIIFNKPK
jgi:hypothetical protein